MAEFDLEAHDALTEKAKEAEFFESPEWAVDQILNVEILTPMVLDPCAGRGVIGDALMRAGYKGPIELDLNEWPGQPGRIRNGVDFLGVGPYLGHTMGGDFSVIMNPPFSLACEFVKKSFEIGARKVLMFQRLAFLESAGRREFFEKTPPARVWTCGSRATCWRGDIPEEDIVVDGKTIKGKKGRSASTPHAWFVWERGHRGAMVTSSIYKDGA